MPRFSSVAVVDGGGAVLLQERDEHPVLDPERWGFPGGGVESGETHEQAAYRELAEETGIVLEAGLRLVESFRVFHEATGTTDEVCLYAVRCDLADDDIVVGEGRRIVFVDAGRARTLDLTTSAALALPRFLDSDLYQEMCR
ncbi:NUDIX domain-containing protein [Nocardioides donggukensis]|uniref:NUDIX domain-containing protein n=1 Tax=Nocardioides donggukensis TaxID=2774019 RepID=A0A927K5W8_9ACTN|nr:NUDIX domain-containing protein [Nocardioides donggukensis]MBD8869603.1 NUDIX domain-containing protein [Nocardioides donggukensis]